MHPRNPYRIPPDFRALADAYPPLEPCLISHSGSFSIDFKDELSQRRLTEALLHRDFGISLDVPMDRLCPPVPNRLNYVLWIEDVIRSTDPLQSMPIVGIDIGTGASAIYPLLSCKLNPNFSFIATDIDKLSLNSASSNVERNGLSERIKIYETMPGAPIFAPLDEDPGLRVDFTMCNPPFYRSREEVAASADAKEFEPNAVCTGADVEMITLGGESSFVQRMVGESIRLGDRCRWYTSMLGKMSSLTEIVGALRAHAIENYGITEFVQGSTRRWAVVWSFSDSRLPDAVARIGNPQLHSLMPPRNTLRQPFTFAGKDPQGLTDLLSVVLASVDGARVVKPEAGAPKLSCFHISAAKNTWSRGARRKLKLGAEDHDSLVPFTTNLVCSTQWIIQEDGAWALEHQWIQGKDRPLFEAFSSHVSRKVTAALLPNPSSSF